MTNLEIIKEAVVKAVPEVMELKRGCFFKEHANPEIFVICAEYGGDNFIAGYQKSNTHFGYDKKFALENFEILGRDITLADVLRTIQAKMLPQKHSVTWFLVGSTVEHDLLDRWNLSHPLHLQSEETLAFLASLFKKD